MRHNTVVIAVCKVGTCQLSLQIKQVGQQYMIVNVSTEQTVNVRMYIGSWHKTFYLTCISKKHCRIILRHFADSASNLQSLSGQTVMPFIDHKVQNYSIIILLLESMHHNTTSLNHTRSRLVGWKKAWCTTPPWSSYHLLLHCRSFSVKFNSCVLDIQVFIGNIYRPSLWVINCNISQTLRSLLPLLYKIHKAQTVTSNCML